MHNGHSLPHNFSLHSFPPFVDNQVLAFIVFCKIAKRYVAKTKRYENDSFVVVFCKFWDETVGILRIMLWMSYLLHLHFTSFLVAAKTVRQQKKGQNSGSFIPKFTRQDRTDRPNGSFLFESLSYLDTDGCL